MLGDQCTVSSQRFLADFADLNAFPIAAGGEQDGAAIQFRDDVQTRIYRTYHNRECYIDCEPVDMEPPPGYATSNRADDTADLQDDTYSLTETTSAVRHDSESTTRKRPKESHALGKSDEPRSKKVKADPVVPNQFATWSRKQAELRADVDAEDQMEADDAAPAIAEVAQSFICIATQKPRADKENRGPLESATKAASDLSTQVAICFLCETTFAQSNSELHLSKSKLHSQRLQDTTRLDRAYAYMKKLKFAPERTVRIQVGTTADRNYFDRAKMRREQEKQQRRELRAQAKAGPKLKMSLGGGVDEDAGTFPSALSCLCLPSSAPLPLGALFRTLTLLYSLLHRRYRCEHVEEARLERRPGPWLWQRPHGTRRAEHVRRRCRSGPREQPAGRCDRGSQPRDARRRADVCG